MVEQDSRSDAAAAPFGTVPFTSQPIRLLQCNGKTIASFIEDNSPNLDVSTVRSFGEEWSRFNGFSDRDIEDVGAEYFDIVDRNVLNEGSLVLDVGCGSGRWSRYVARRAKFVEAIDPSMAVIPAVQLTHDLRNVRVSQAAADDIPFPDGTFDVVMSLGVLHHIPNTQQALTNIVRKLRKGGHCLLYIYYDLDNRSRIYRWLFYLVHILRLAVCRLPDRLKHFICDVIAYTVYLPLIATARLAERLLPCLQIHERLPLSYYKNKRVWVIRNDALDRFGTPLEQRFTQERIRAMMEQSGLTDIVFSKQEPYWHALGKKTSRA